MILILCIKRILLNDIYILIIYKNKLYNIEGERERDAA